MQRCAHAGYLGEKSFHRVRLLGQGTLHVFLKDGDSSIPFKDILDLR